MLVVVWNICKGTVFSGLSEMVFATCSVVESETV